jgi:hypothetical protein
MSRSVLAALAAALLIVILVPSAAGQQEPYIEHRVLWTPGGHAERKLDLGEDGRGQVGTEIGFRVVGRVTCAETAGFSLESMVWNPQPHWAGGSLVPEAARRAEFSLPAGTHEDTAWKTRPAADLAIAWDMESRPADPSFTYEVRVESAHLVPETRDCEPPLTTREQSALSAFLETSAPAPPAEDDGDDADGGRGGGAPAAGPAVAVAALVVAAMARRRR